MAIFADGILLQAPNGWTIVGILIGVIAALLGGYFKTSGEQLATRRYFDQILEEAVKTREAIQRVESKFARSRFIGENEIAYRERQLSEFYGPIYGSIKSTGRLWWLSNTPHALDPITAEVQELFRVQNDAIVDILKTKAHLVEGYEIPRCFARYMTSVTIFNIGTRLGGGLTPEPVRDLPEASFPDEFFKYIIETTELLKRNLNQLYIEHGYSVRGEAKVASSPQ